MQINMSQRGKSGKRQPNKNDDSTATGKRRKGRPKATPAVEDEDEGWTAREVKGGSIYNQRAPEAPAELFRKDLISAMKLPDNEPLASDEFFVIADQWKPEWERGVQVPVNPDSLPEPHVTIVHTQPKSHQFKLPKNKYIRITADERLRSEEIHLSSVAARAEAACHYDLDDVDVAWLAALNGERALMGFPSVSEEQLERVLEELEHRCWDRIQGLLKAEEGLGIEYDENVVCDVCRSPDSEDGNEMVFCDACNICVHQACYGITTIPPGSWLCRTCALSKRPECVLCPNKGGAMKSTKLGQEWAHVSCALWIPEVSIGCVEKMEPITKIANIPQSRWALICVLCRERVGACIQCSVKTCKTAYHVTCAFKNNLEMRAIVEDEMADDGVKLRSYCQKHSVKKEPCAGDEDEEGRKKKRKDMTSEERNQARAAKLQEIEAEFYKHVSIADVAGSAVLLEVDSAAIESVYNYWKLKRRAGNNVPLLPPRTDDPDMLHRRQGQQDRDKMRLFVQLRQDLERVRNLCYMVSRREKLSRSYLRTREQTFHKQAALLASNAQLSPQEVAAILQANHGPTLYDRLYSHKDAPDNTLEFDKILMRIQGGHNGLAKGDANPYKKSYVNGTTRRRSLFGSSSESADERRPTRISDSSSEDDRWSQKPLRRLQRELGRSFSEDSDDLMPLPPPARSAPITRLGGHIYSDTDSEASLHDDQNATLKTKGALKAFTGADKKKVLRKAASKADKENIKSSKAAREIIVPERTAARKAVEHIRASKRKREDQAVSSDEKDKAKAVKPASRIEKGRTPREDRSKDSALGDKDNLLGYVPQRQAAKKATETIKSGLKQPDDIKLVPEKKKEEPKKKVEEVRKRSPRSVSSSSSSSSCSSTSTTDSSSETEEERPKTAPKSIFDPEPISRKEDWPFLDKESQSNALGDKKFKKAPDKKLKTSDGRPESEFQPPTLTRDEPRARASDRARSSGARPRDLTEDAHPAADRGKGKSGSLFEERGEATRGQSAKAALGKSDEKGSGDQRKPSRNAELVKEPPPESPVKQKKDELPVKRGPGRPRRASTRGESPRSKPRDNAIPNEEESKPKAKPMPRSVKKALGLLDENSPEKKEVEPLEEVIVQDSVKAHEKRSIVAEKNFDKDKFRRSTRLLSEERIVSPVTDNIDNNNVGPPKEISKVDMTDRASPTLDLGLEAEAQKAVQGFTSRSIFSPQPSRDNLADILDFEDDISAVDETVHEERPLGLFNFSNDLLFREDTKEDSKRETYNLVEKLRMEYAKKCGTQESTSPCPKEDMKDVSKSSENGLSHSETATDSQGPPPTPGCHLDSQPAPPGKCTPNSQDSHASLNKSDSPASQMYQQQNTPLTPLSQTYQQQHTPQTPSSQSYPQQHTPQTPSSQSYPQQHTPQTPSSQNYPQQHTPQTPSSQSYPQHHTPQTPYMQQNTPQTPYIQHPGALTPTSYPAHNTPQTPLAQNYQEPQTPNSQAYQPAAGLTPQAFTNSQTSIAGAYTAGTPSTPLSGFPPAAASFNGTATFPPGSTIYPTGTSLDGIYETCANALREGAKLMGPTLDKVEGGSNSDERWLPPNSNASSSVYPSPSENYPRWQDSQVITRRSSSASVTSESESKEPEAPKTDGKHVITRPHQQIVEHIKPESEMYLPPYPPENSTYHPYSDTAPFVLPFPFGPQMYHPIPPKPPEQPVGLAFTSSQPNMSLTAALVSNALDQETCQNSNQSTNSKKPSSKPTRVSARTVSQTKSPEKSPKGKESAPRRGRATGSTGRSRGRGRGRGRHTPVYDDFALRTKLVGTVYDMDFEEDGLEDSLENLKAMRDRRKSTDVHEKKPDSASPRAAPGQPTTAGASSQVFPDVAPPLPGPVDMRTYSSFEPPVNSTEYQNNLLNAFANPAEASQVNDFDEEMEKELQSALTASPVQTLAPPTPTSTPPVRPESAETPDNVSKTSLSDSRNQLKVKIKGPFRDENYSATSTTIASAPPPVQPAPPVQAALTGTLRRMRKKELLRQYWTQDMNKDEGAAPAAPQAPPPSRTAITIPKAVASMTSIPTREDYKALIDANSDKKRKNRDLDISDEEEPLIPERRSSTGSNTSSRRSKVPKPPTPTPKLKIKLGAVPVIDNVEKKVLRVRPPKKRHMMDENPYLKDFIRDSMEYRRKIMMDFGEDIDEDDEEEELDDEDDQSKRRKRVLEGFYKQKSKRRNEEENDKPKSKKRKEDEDGKPIKSKKKKEEGNDKHKSKKKRKEEDEGKSEGKKQDNAEDEVKLKNKKKKKRKSRDEPQPPAPTLIIKVGSGYCMTVNPTPRTQHDTDGRTDAPPPAAETDPLAIAPTDAPPPPPPFPLPVVPVNDVSSVPDERTSKSSPIRLKFARSEQGAYVMAAGSDAPAECPPVPVR